MRGEFNEDVHIAFRGLSSLGKRTEQTNANDPKRS
jgi:hypothetical protein